MTVKVIACYLPTTGLHPFSLTGPDVFYLQDTPDPCLGRYQMSHGGGMRSNEIQGVQISLVEFSRFWKPTRPIMGAAPPGGSISS
jgi:hypothetical protein